LVGFSDEPFASYVNPSITSINQHSTQIGKMAAEALLNRINNPTEKVALNKIILDAELIVRASSNKTKL